jgi:hypothetical protein
LKWGWEALIEEWLRNKGNSTRRLIRWCYLIHRKCLEENRIIRSRIFLSLENRLLQLAKYSRIHMSLVKQTQRIWATCMFNFSNIKCAWSLSIRKIRLWMKVKCKGIIILAIITIIKYPQIIIRGWPKIKVWKAGIIQRTKMHKGNRIIYLNRISNSNSKT